MRKRFTQNGQAERGLFSEPQGLRPQGKWSSQAGGGVLRVSWETQSLERTSKFQNPSAISKTLTLDTTLRIKAAPGITEGQAPFRGAILSGK